MTTTYRMYCEICDQTADIQHTAFHETRRQATRLGWDMQYIGRAIFFLCPEHVGYDLLSECL